MGETIHCGGKHYDVPWWDLRADSVIASEVRYGNIGTSNNHSLGALNIAKERYAKGEITRQVYLEMKNLLKQ
jgi:uncharacterized membrane protein